MKAFPLSVCLYFLIIFPVHAQLYKWYDEHGRVHYSDKPQPNASSKKIIKIESDTASNSTTTVTRSAVNPIIRPYDKTNRKLILLDTRYTWKTASGASQRTEIGNYHISKGCLSRGRMVVPDVYLNHASLFPSEQSLAREISRNIRSLDYTTSYTDRYKLIEELRSSGGLSLHSEIISLDFDTCAPRFNSYKYKNGYKAEQLPASDFKLHRITMTVRWTLKDNRDQNTLYEAQTTGYYDGWHIQSSGSEAMTKAIANATSQLLSKQEFIDNILISENLPTETFTFNGTGKATPIYNTPEIGAGTTYYLSTDLGWLQQLRAVGALGEFRYGSSCATSNPMKWDDIYNHHKQLLPGVRDLNDNLTSYVSSLEYPIKKATDAKQIPGTADFILTSRIVQANWEACAPSMSSSAKFVPVDSIKTRELRRHKIGLTIEWTLKSGNEVLYTGQSSGSAGDLNLNMDSRKVFNDAVLDAASRLYADSVFIGYLKATREDLVVINTFPSPLPTDPIVRSPDLELKPLLVSTEEHPWLHFKSSANKSIGKFYSGEYCRPVEDKLWSTMLNNFSRTLPSGGAISAAVTQALYRYDYSSKNIPKNQLAKIQRKEGSLALVPRVTDIQYDSCYRTARDDFARTWNRKNARSFDRHRAAVTVEWSLIDADNKVVFKQTQKGASDRWDVNSGGTKVVNEAIENSLLAMLSDPAFVEALKEHNDKGFFSKFF